MATDFEYQQLIKKTKLLFRNVDLTRGFQSSLDEYVTNIEKAQYCAKVIKEIAAKFWTEPKELRNTKKKDKDDIKVGLNEYITLGDSYRLQYTRSERDKRIENKRLVSEVYNKSIKLGLIVSKRKQKRFEWNRDNIMKKI